MQEDEEYGGWAHQVPGGNSRLSLTNRKRSGVMTLLAPAGALLLAWSSTPLRAESPRGEPAAPPAASKKANSQQLKLPKQHNLAAIAAHRSSRDVSAATSHYREVLNQYCVVCHNQQLRTAGLTLDKVDVGKVPEGAQVWEKVLDKLRAEAMPPAGMPRPDPAFYHGLVSYLETSLDHAAAVKPEPGRVAIHRLNRAEYTNAVRDLLATAIDGESLLPVDDSGYGFDNIADVLSVSPMLLTRYMSAAGKVARLAIGDPDVRPNLESYDIPYLLTQDDRMSEDLPFGSRGGIAIRHNFPCDGEYVIKIRLQRAGIEHDRQIIGMSAPHQMDIRLDGQRVKLLTVGGQAAGKKKAFGYDNSARTLDSDAEVRFSAKAGTRLVGINFVNDDWEREGVLESSLAQYRLLDKSSEGRSDSPGDKGDAPAVSQVSIAGPYNPQGMGDTPSRRKIFVCHPTSSADELPCAKKIISNLARHAYRRPVTDEDLRPLLSVYKVGRREGNFEAGISTALQRILVSPEFLFRIERDPSNLVAGAVYRVDDLELASRLSFFLWSSIPDDELLNQATAGKLKDPVVLEHQVRRMLADPKSRALVTNFFGQWLYLRNMPGVHPDPEAFPDFDENLRAAFEQETQLFLDSNLREDRSVLNLLNANYTFLNDRLAKFYGIPNVYGSQFRRVSLVGHDERRGLLGQGSVLTVTSYANRTSPTLRGKWLLSNVLGTPPPPPPPDVPSLKEDKKQQTLTMRERMEQHRANPACSVCHARMDPMGFALENFNGIGEWRTVGEGHTPIDASGALPEGTKFNGPAELRKLLLSHPDQFASSVTEELLTYALGRGVEYYDKPAIRKIVRDAGASDYHWSSIILGIVNSAPFRMRMTRPPKSDANKPLISQSSVEQTLVKQ
jgi:mono/diheme cytochrome c family protein